VVAVHVLVDGFVDDALHLLGEGSPVLLDVLLLGLLLLLVLNYMLAKANVIIWA
jgi:hypothetical protein